MRRCLTICAVGIVPSMFVIGCLDPQERGQLLADTQHLDSNSIKMWDAEGKAPSSRGLRSRGLGQWVAHTPGGPPTETIEIELPNGKVKVFRFRGSAVVPPGQEGRESWHGTEDATGSSLNLFAQNHANGRRVIAGSFADGNSVYQLGQDADGNAIVQRFDDLPDESCADVRDEFDEPAQEEATAEGDINTETGNPIIDVLVVWTAHAECRNSGQPQGCTLTEQTESNMHARVQLAVDETNVAYASSGVNAELRSVYAYRHPNYIEADSNAFNSALIAIRSTTDGVMDDVHTRRDQYGADVVAMMIDDPQYCGLAYLGPSTTSMFSVTAWNCATGYFSFGHEIGHNLGLRHDLGTSNACNATSYNYAWRDPDGQFRTILAYNCRTDQCDNITHAGCTRIQRFSNPNIPHASGAPLGASNANNSLRLNEVVPVVSAYYSSGTCVTDTDCDFCSGFSCQNGECQETSLPLQCDDNNACTEDTCDSSSGGCHNEPIPECCFDDSECEDGNACTTDTCDVNSNSCVHTPPPALQCDDNNPCTADTCDPSSGGCLHEPIPECCFDDSGCEDDGNACTTDTCDVNSNSCVHAPVPGCCGNGVCETGEDCYSCDSDCLASQAGYCGDGICDESDPAENCMRCPQDCAGKTTGKLSTRFCCGFDDGEVKKPVGCNHSRCDADTYDCQSNVLFCCGDSVCAGPEDSYTCALDCGVP